MKTITGILLCLAAFAATAEARLRVVATLPSLGDEAREIGGDRVDIVVLAKPNQDPHFVDAKPSFIVELRNADLFLVDGLELEIGWVPPLLEQCRNGEVQAGARGYLDCSRFVAVIDLPNGQVDRSMGDVHPLGNPHYTIDPIAMRRVASGIADKLSELDPEGAKVFAANLKTFHRKLDEAMFGKALVDEAGGGKLARLAESGELEQWLTDNKLADKLGGWFADMAPAKGKEVVAYHTSMNYFWARFGMKLAATVEPKPGIPPTGKHTADVILLVKEKGVKVVATQPWYDDSAVKQICSRGGCASISLETEGDDLVATIGGMVKQVSGAMK